MWNPWDHSEHKESNVKTTQTLCTEPSTGVWSKSHCSVHVLKAILWFFTPLNYIQTLRIQIFFFRNVGHAFLLHLHIIEKSPWTESDRADLAISKIKNASTLKKKKKAFVEKQRLSCSSSYNKKKSVVKFRLFFYKDSNNSSVKSCLMYKKHQITALDSKDVLFLGYTFF